MRNLRLHMSQLKTLQTTWNLNPLFNGDNDPKIKKDRENIKKKSYQFINKWKDRTDYLQEPKILKQALDEYENWARYYGPSGKEGYYFWLRTQQNQNDPQLKARCNKVMDFSTKIQNDIQFFTLKIAKIPEKDQHKFLEYKKLEPYKHFLETLFAEAKYLLSEPEEKILNLKTMPAHSNWTKMVAGFISKEEREILTDKGKKQKKTFPELISLIDSTKKRTRDSAAKAVNQIFEKHADTAEHELNSILGNKKIDDELRKLPRPDAARHLNDDVDSIIVDTLVKAVSNRFDISKKYYKLKSTLFNVPQLRYHERNVPYGKLNKKYTYKNSINLIHKVFTNLDQEFADILDEFLQNGYFDVFPKKGKRNGAFCVYDTITTPTYILLNHTDQLTDTLTLAHEMGHGINDELMKKHQNALNFGTPLSTAEVASTFMEDFVLEEILKKASKKLKLSLMMMKLNSDISTIFRQIACYKFEQEIHNTYRQKGYLSKEEIGNIFQKHMIAYMGKYVEQSKGSQNWWVYWSHIRSFFYVYSYASGLLISKSLQNSVKKNQNFMKKIKKFLSAGRSDSPKNVFLKLDVDITNKQFWDKGLKEVENLLTETEKLAKNLGEI